MTEFKIKIEDEVLTALGQENIERHISFMPEQLHRSDGQLKAAAQDALEDLSSIDLANDPAWKQARDKAWEKYIHKLRCR
jgi:hypothetical protein